MKNQSREIIIILIVVFITLINGFSLSTVFMGTNEISSVKDQKKQPSLVNDLKLAKQTIDLWKTREQLTLNENVASQEASPEAKMKLQILNGSGLAGKANTVKNGLLGLENILQITTGNTEATSSTSMKSKNRVNSETKAKIKELLAKEFPQITETVLLDNSPFDIVLVLGTNK